jgi:hypothetical protein
MAPLQSKLDGMSRNGQDKNHTGMLPCLPKGLAGYGKTLWAHRNFTDLHVWDNRSTPRRMLKKAVQQGRSERRGESVRFGTLSF